MPAVDIYSRAAVPIDACFDNEVVSTATAFVWRHQEATYLITSWHVASGRHPFTRDHLDSQTLVEPNKLIAHVLDPGAPERRIPVEVALRSGEGAPLWLQHQNRQIDIAAIKLSAEGAGATPAVNELRAEPLELFVASNVFVLGYPLPFRSKLWPVWKHATVATDPLEPINGLPYFLIDTATRKGMSGAPVILRSVGGYAAVDNVSRLVGIYSGREGIAEDDRFQLGIVWHAALINQVLDDPLDGVIE